MARGHRIPDILRGRFPPVRFYDSARKLIYATKHSYPSPMDADRSIAKTATAGSACLLFAPRKVWLMLRFIENNIHEAHPAQQ